MGGLLSIQKLFSKSQRRSETNNNFVEYVM